MSDLTRKAFEVTADAAIAEAAIGREELGRQSAAAFRAAPDAFNPRDLLKLGDVGLRAFGAAMGVQHAMSSKPTAAPTTSPPAETEQQTGWSSQQCRSIPFERAGLLLGIIAGLVSIAVITLRAWLNG